MAHSIALRVIPQVCLGQSPSPTFFDPYLRQSYPELGRLAAIQLLGWQAFVNDFLRHSCAFAKNRPAGSESRPLIHSIRSDCSAPHNGGRSVIWVRFRDRSEWFYKPRSGYQELAWFRLLEWLNSQGFPTPFQVLRVKSADQHCWVEAVRARACRSRKEVSLYYFRAGALSYLIHIFRGVDFHSANLIAAGDQPIFVDIETLLHSATFLPPGARREEGSILRTGLFPLERGHNCHSAFGEGESGQHTPHLAGQLMCATDFARDLIAGFQTMNRFLRTRFWRIRRVAASLTGTSARTVYRPTMQYVATLQQSFTPSLMRSTLERRQFLVEACRTHAGSARQLRTEVQALQNADVPIFRTKRRCLRLNLTDAEVARSVAIVSAKLAKGRMANYQD